MVASKDVDNIQKRVVSFIKNACEVSAKSTISKANSIVYADAKYATGNFKNSIVKGNATYNGDTVSLDIHFAPVNIKSNIGKVYAQPLDEGHKLVYFGKPTNKIVKGKHFSEPAAQTGRTVLESILREI